MSWLNEDCLSIFQRVCIKIMKIGRIPRHLAFIMDGNRRYGAKICIERTAAHYKGFDKLTEALKWCLELGISEVTVYVFSIENFKRTQDEVESLMKLSEEKFKIFLDDIDNMNELGIRMSVVGRLSLLPEELQILIKKAMLATRNNKKLRLNMAYAYTGRDEISRAASVILDGVKNKQLSPNEINEALVSHTLDLGEPELLIRTSGEVRLSDFMLWQVSNSVLYFSNVLWPEISFWDMLAAIIHYWIYAPPALPKTETSAGQKEFMEYVDNKKWQDMEKISIVS